MNVRARSTHAGCIGCLPKYTEELLSFIIKLREKGMGVTVPMVVTKASQMSVVFRKKSTPAKNHSARRFIRSHGLVFCIATNESQRSPQEVAAGEALDVIMNVVCPKVMETRHQDFILNMDQTPVPFTYNARKMLEIVGRCTVHIRESTRDTKRATLFAMTVAASGKVLKPAVIFLKGFEMAELSNVNFQIIRMIRCTSANALLGWMKLPCWSGVILCFSHTLNRHQLE